MTDRPNVLLITFDSLRPDHLGCYGYRGTGTPHWDQMATEGVRFSTAYCHAPNTWMSHAALMTGCNPPRNGVRSPLGRIDATVPTLAATLKDQGYSTFGLPSLSLLSREAGFGRGFDAYLVEGLVSEFAGAAHHRPTADMLQAVNDWWRTGRTAKAPAFVWLHYFGTHVAQGTAAERMLELPEPYRAAYSRYAQFYDGKIAYADAEFLGPVLAILGCERDRENWVVVLTSDHGEDLAAVEQGLPGHDQDLTEGSVRVPLVVWAPGRLQANTVVEEPVRLIDVLPTVIDLAGLPTGGLTCDGDSLRPLAGNDAVGGSASGRDVYFENASQGYLGMRRGKLKLVLTTAIESAGFLKSRVGWRIAQIGGALLSSRMLSKIDADRRRREQQRRLETPVPTLVEGLLAPATHAELHDLNDDPNEMRNVASERPDDVEGLRSVLRVLAQGIAPAGDTFTDEERAAIEERLSDLGYL
jgi:arylsulfatase A-like enzyme